VKKFVSLLGVSAAAFIATPAAAQVAAPTGARVEALVGYDAIRIDLEDFGVDETVKDSGVLYGFGLGYDFAVGGVSLGADLEATDSTAKEGDEDTGSLSAARDLYAGLRATFPVSQSANVYLKGGYTNARFKAELDGESEGENADGFRLGAGAQFTLSGKAYVGGEYRYSNYEADLSRHQFALTVGTRF
jgi:outer membrane immunogenic protein